MGILNKTVEVTLNSKTVRHYENLGYKIPKSLDKKGRFTIKMPTKIIVDIKDLSKGSGIKIDVKCDCCGKEYKIEYYNYFNHNHNGKIYCKACGKKILNSGENNYSWDFNKTQEEREVGRATQENIEWIKKCMMKANYESQISKKTDNLEVHHLNDWANHKEQRYNIDNGIVLTKDEHKTFHTWQRINYPKQPCTREQFEEWIKGMIINEGSLKDKELPTTRKIYCIEENNIYNSAIKLAKEWKLKNTNHIYEVCNHKPKKYLVKGKHLLWYDEYLKMNELEIQEYLVNCKLKKRNINCKYGKFNNKSKKIICITTGKEFSCLREAGEYYNIKNYTHINNCCRNKQKTCGKLEDGTKLQWMYYDDYVLLED